MSTTTEKAATGGATGAVVTLTAAARAHVLSLLKEQDIPAEEQHLRIMVQAGGCSGFSYGLAFDRRNDDDVSQPCEGFDVIVDPKSLPHLKGLAVDFVDSVQEQGFKITNPNAVSSCGCGQSFQSGG